jgi:hypothetical protein
MAPRYAAIAMLLLYLFNSFYVLGMFIKAYKPAKHIDIIG